MQGFRNFCLLLQRGKFNKVKHYISELTSKSDEKMTGNHFLGGYENFV